jgi:hypothetical protein
MILDKIFDLFKRKDKSEMAKQEAEKYTKVVTESLPPKEAATLKKEPYVAVLNTHINEDNIRNGFFELDWNEYFIVKLREAGYTGDSEEEVVDAWFKDLCKDVAAEESVNMERRGAGFININSLGNGKAEIF